MGDRIKHSDKQHAQVCFWSAVLLLLLPSLRLRPRLRLILLLSMEPMPDTHMLPDMPDTAMDTHHMDTQLTVTDTTERDLLMLSQRLRLMLTTVFMDTVMDMLLLMLMVLTHIPMVPMEESGDKLNATQLKEAQKQTTNINDTQFPKNKLNYCWCRNLS